MSSVHDEPSGLVFTLGGRAEDFAPPEKPWLDVSTKQSLHTGFYGAGSFLSCFAKNFKVKRNSGKILQFFLYN